MAEARENIRDPQFPDRLMIVQGETRITYAEGFAQAAALARSLRETFGIGQGSMVAVVTANRPEWLISMIAITSLGAIAALVNSRGVAEEVLHVIDKVEAALVILDAERDAAIAADCPDPGWPRVVIGEPVHPLRRGKDAGFAALAEPVPGLAFTAQDMDPEDGAIVLYTSGTTGFPKGALLSHGALTHSVNLATMMGAMQDIRYEEESGERLPERQRAMATPAVILLPRTASGKVDRGTFLREARPA